MTYKNKRAANWIFLPAFCTTAALILSGCAAPKSETGPFATIEVEKAQPTSASDCPISLKILNRMSGIAWDGVSYQLAFRNKSGTAVGESRGIPRKYIEPGSGVAFSGQVKGVRCEEIASVSLIYFGYYPPGQGQIRVNNSVVQVSIR